MKKLLFSILVLFSLHANTMDNHQRLLIAGGAAASAIGGHLLAKKIYMQGYREFNAVTHRSPMSDEYKTARSNYILKSTLSVALRSSSFLLAGILGCYAYSGKLPENNAQTYVSTATFTVGGGFCGMAHAKKQLDQLENRGRKKKLYKAILMSGMAMQGLGTYGFYRNY